MSIGVGVMSQVSTTGMPDASKRLRPSAECMMPVSTMPSGRRPMIALLDAIIGRRPDGIVLTGIMHSAEGRRRLLASGIPVVETWDITPTPIDMVVGFSHEKVGAAVADYLYGQGFRKPGIVSASDERAMR